MGKLGKVVNEERVESTACMRQLLVRYLVQIFVALVAVAFVVGLGSILGLVPYATRLQILLLVFSGPTYLFLHPGWFGLGLHCQSPSMFQGCRMGMDSAYDLVRV